ncbi:type II toxin-antitoxin system RelE/ParE family toxin [Roseicella aerolata]|uniref:Type II toxin-antitoxin system RelE/ParE family toxin n=1 Tax=Roseicella aerolata TaxID=2883479 RepID=A0A9X1IIY2_9PROT|nr:type II toxin-antitoxin system RelE/ParE family toxin [Roseicella aerolata]MCB4825499.1 type II toxin-antitoxin system RelE/ParE family toxin [Roseicella aerolata]
MALRLLKNKGFARFARKEGLTDQALCEAAKEVEDGLVDARLGGFLLKKRVAKGSSGKSGGFRTIVAHRQGQRLIFLFGFGKGERDNIDEKEKLALLKLGEEYMGLSRKDLSGLIASGVLVEVKCDAQK